MLIRAARIALVLHLAVWLNVVIPGHTRGRYTVPGSRSSAERAASACCAQRSTARPVERNDQPTPDQRARCAICYFALGLSTPPPIDWEPAPLAALNTLAVPAAVTIDSHPFRHTYFGRAPPAA
jgi:hypothetical protein